MALPQATLSEHAIKQYEAENDDSTKPKRKRFFINYKQLPDIIWDHVLPTLGVTSMKAADIHRMEKVAAMYTQSRTTSSSKRGGKAVFTGDSKQKEEDVPFAIAQAAHLFMDGTYDKLEAISKDTLQSNPT